MTRRHPMPFGEDFPDPDGTAPGSTDLDELLAVAQQIIDHPDTHAYRPLLMLQLLVAIAREVRS